MLNLKRLFTLGLFIGSLVAFSAASHGFHAADELLVRESITTLVYKTDFTSILNECDTIRSYFHISNGVPESDYFKNPGLYVVIDQDCEWGERSMYINPFSEGLEYERLERVPFYPSMS